LEKVAEAFDYRKTYQQKEKDQWLL